MGAAGFGPAAPSSISSCSRARFVSVIRNPPLLLHVRADPVYDHLGDLIAVPVHHHHMIVTMDADLGKMDALTVASYAVQRVDETKSRR